MPTPRRVFLKHNGRRAFISLRQEAEPLEQHPPHAIPPSPATGSVIGEYVKRKPLPTFKPLPKVDHALTDLFIAKERIGPSGVSRYSRLLYPVKDLPTAVPKLELSQLERDLASIDEALKDPDRAIRNQHAALERFNQSPSFQPGLDLSTRSPADRQLLQDSPVLTDLLKRIVTLSARRSEDQEMVSLRYAIRRYSELGLMQDQWPTLFYGYLVKLISMLKHPRFHSDGGVMHVTQNMVLRDICEIWKLFFDDFLTQNRQPQVDNPIDRTTLDEMESVAKQAQGDDPQPHPQALRLPSMTELGSFAFTASGETRTSLLEFCAFYSGQVEGNRLALAAAISCRLINSFENGIRDWAQSIPNEETHNAFIAFALCGRCLGKVQTIAAYKSMNLGPNASRAMEAEIIALRSESVDQVAKIKASLNKAVKERNVKLAISQWNFFQQKVEKAELSDEQQEALHGPFLTAFFALRDAKRAIEIWNYMIQSDQKVREQHWLIMIQGAMRHGDINSLEAIWQHGQAAGVQPDNEMWKFYLQGLFRFRQGAKAMRVVDDMGAAWKLEASSAHQSPPQETTSSNSHRTQPQASYLPDMGPVNVVIHGLLKTRRKRHALQVLDWAAAYNLRADVRTYRHLLFDAIGADDVDEVHKLLHDLQAANVTPNVEIFTILMDFAFRNSQSDFQLQSPEQQQEAVTKVLADMEEAGIQADTFTYGTLLDGLLRPPCLNVTAARAIIEQMAAKKIPISPHIHTILMTHYFSQNPPDLAAVDSLWAKIQTEKHVVDHVFFDRLIDAYARIGDLEKMLIFLRKMVAVGKMPGWGGLSRILRALADAQEWGWAQDLLRDVVDERGLLRYGSRNVRGKEEFWALVKEIREVGLDLPEQPPDLYVPIGREYR